MCKFYAEYMYVCGHTKAYSSVPAADYVVYASCEAGTCRRGMVEQRTSFPVFKNCAACGLSDRPSTAPSSFPFNQGTTFATKEARQANIIVPEEKPLNASSLAMLSAVSGSPQASLSQKVGKWLDAVYWPTDTRSGIRWRLRSRDPQNLIPGRNMCKFYAEYMYVCGHTKPYYSVPTADRQAYMSCSAGGCTSGVVEEFTSWPVFTKCSSCGLSRGPSSTRGSDSFPFTHGTTTTSRDTSLPSSAAATGTGSGLFGSSASVGAGASSHSLFSDSSADLDQPWVPGATGSATLTGLAAQRVINDALHRYNPFRPQLLNASGLTTNSALFGQPAPNTTRSVSNWLDAVFPLTAASSSSSSSASLARTSGPSSSSTSKS
ncbi:hypothetical protein SCUCBS95973_009820 [Sporothrix curviconia]|uniref:Uncharacterized protein n=1 Tax=Sporothrix curviconia TaxID=1260050 RepID=A0ABP0CZ40_9PEZI